MKKTALRRLEALEMEERSREQKELSSLAEARIYIWIIVLAYYLGGLESDWPAPGLDDRAAQVRNDSVTRG
jgi:hypothetical protein